MKILFLGTGSGKVSTNRFHSSILLSVKDYNLLIDAGDGIARSIITAGINFNSIHGILLTHLHPDHFSGLSSLLVQMKMLGRTNPLDIFIYYKLKTQVENILLQSYIFSERLGFEIRYKTFENDIQFVAAHNLSIIARQNSHLSHLENYKKIYPTLSFYSASFLIRAENKKIIYTSDIGVQEDLYLYKEIISDIFITEVTHLPVSIILEELLQISGGKFYLTHYADEDATEISEILSSFIQRYNLQAKLAEDRLIVEI